MPKVAELLTCDGHGDGEYCGLSFGDGTGDGIDTSYGDGNGKGYGDGAYCGLGNGNGYGHGGGNGVGNGYGNGHGYRVNDDYITANGDVRTAAVLAALNFLVEV